MAGPPVVSTMAVTAATNCSGSVSLLKPERGYGFVQPDGQRSELFFHCSAMQGIEFEQLLVEQRVVFDIVESDGRSRAVNVRPEDIGRAKH